MKDKVSIAKIVKICSKCDIALNEELKKFIIHELNQGGKLPGVPLDREFLHKHAIPFLDQLKEELSIDVLKQYFDKSYDFLTNHYRETFRSTFETILAVESINNFAEVSGLHSISYPLDFVESGYIQKIINSREALSLREQIELYDLVSVRGEHSDQLASLIEKRIKMQMVDQPESTLKIADVI